MYSYCYTDGMRRTLIIIGLAIVVAIAAFVLSGRGQHLQNNPLQDVASANLSPRAVPFTKLARGTYSTVTKRVNYLITSPTELDELWQMLDAKGNKPAVDFTRNEVIAVFAGQQQDAHHEVTVSEVQDATARTISITFTNPSAKCASKKVTTAPYEVIAIPTTSLPITHENISTTTTCSE